MNTIFTDADIISIYTRKQAIEDGTLVDLSASFPDISRQFYKYPVACTAAVWAIIETAVENKRHCNDFAGVVHDVLNMARFPSHRIDEAQHLYRVIITGIGRQKVHTLKMVCGPGDNAEPVLTIMMPEED